MEVPPNVEAKEIWERALDTLECSRLVGMPMLGVKEGTAGSAKQVGYRKPTRRRLGDQFSATREPAKGTSQASLAVQRLTKVWRDHGGLDMAREDLWANDVRRAYKRQHWAWYVWPTSHEGVTVQWR